MANSQVTTIDQLQSLCDSTAKHWSSFQFKRQPGVPSELFGATWTSSNALGHIKMSYGDRKKFGIGMMCIGVLPAIAAFPIGLVGTAITGGIGLYTYAKSKIHPHDEKLITEQFSKFQEDLEKILDSSKALARSLNRELSEAGASEQERRAALEKIDETVRDFLIDNIGVSEKVLKTGKAPGTRRGPFADETALHVSVKALKEIDHEISTRPTSPRGGASSREIGHQVTRNLGTDIPPRGL